MVALAGHNNHNILLAYCICRWHLSCGILLYHASRILDCIFINAVKWRLFYLPPGLTFTFYVQPTNCIYMFVQGLSSYTALTVFYDRDWCAYCAARTEFRLSFVCKRLCHSEARLRYEASPCEHFGGQGGRWNIFSLASITATLVFNP